ncbi:PadR family transcriptional regulator [Egibacter rhizosphaerae]|uniref:PadR family transcriptional regulator n=1 Tax=Egibacter rhizosphaerae TaxID=1670831 RepID=A0A411YEX4_9ACTN|nr:PadR family transcriptional regulator [Egibacter rhizosphaerae]QBI19768.1 PadR family transcriptional regulator [Egibacter rhizosphaerae]
MPLRHALLGMLSEHPHSGWDLTKRFEQSLGNVWTASHSQVYTELGKLEVEGLIEVVGTGARGRKDYAATEAGRAEATRWLRETEPSRSVRNEPILRVFLLWLLEPEEARAYLERERDRHAEQLAFYEQLAHDWPCDSAAVDASRIALEAGLRVERAYVEWAEWAAARYCQADETRDGDASG